MYSIGGLPIRSEMLGDAPPAVPDWTEVTYGNGSFTVSGLEGGGFQAKLTDAVRRPHRHPEFAGACMAVLVLVIVVASVDSSSDAGGAHNIATNSELAQLGEQLPDEGLLSGEPGVDDRGTPKAGDAHI